MTLLLLFVLVIIGLNCIPVLTRHNFPKLEKAVIRLSNYSLIAFMVTVLLMFMYLKLKGSYTNFTIGLLFIVSNLLYFCLVKNTRAKIIRVVVTAPVILFCLVTLFFLSRVVGTYQIDETHNIQVTHGGFMACGESININETKFLLFDKNIHHVGNLCLMGITNIETLKFDTKKAVFLIYHDGEMDSENPYRYEFERSTP